MASLINVLEYCRSYKAGLVLLSTSRVYSIPVLASLPLRTVGNAFHLDDSGPLPPGVSKKGIGPDFVTIPPISLYGSTKLASEGIALEYGHAFGFPIWINRCGVLAGAGQFGTSYQGIFSYWINAHLRRRALRYLGFHGTGMQMRDALHPTDLAALICAEIATPRANGRRVYTVGGGPDNAMSLAELTAWCDLRFGRHTPEADPRPRNYDVPWVILDNSDAERDFGWRIKMPIENILQEIAAHAELNPEWLEVSGS